MACGSILAKLTKLATDFVSENNGTWGHDEWEVFCEKASKIGIELNAANKEALGNLLESTRYFYQICPSIPDKKPKPRKKTTE